MSRYWVAFYRGRGRMMDHVMRFATRSPYSHCELIRQDDRPRRGDKVVCLGASARDGGVRVKAITLDNGKWDIYEVPWARECAWDRALAQRGKPYELWPMFLSQLFNFRRHSRGKWYCSELIAHALGLNMPHAKSPGDLLRAIDAHRRTWIAAQDLQRRSRRAPPPTLNDDEGFDPIL